ncbi:acyl-CoA-binding domain-containing protein 5-like [Paramacrobiotus metropolitanus]|uniref:acyl-CoA-binding domain-containing protein 5-like n=1 Tax=Paramacrobiotus metropolitanus TaxID=2943436 RepID=UPI002445A4E3|nr:acyl-CoA-binding domain-containing protein 5-like [Paramacrobiotus metropolitanus]
MSDYVGNGIEDRFNAAVNVIRTLPANGSFQPSREMMLRFYALFKQATVGACTTPRPYFFDPKCVKWDAHNSLNGISREEAMEEYVTELKKIVEMMSLTPEVSQFLDKLGSFYELVNDEGKIIGGGERKQAPLPVATIKAEPDSSSSSGDSQLSLVNGFSGDARRLPQLMERVSNMLNAVEISSEEDSEDLEVEAFQDAVHSAPQERRLSGDSFKSQPVSPEPTRNEVVVADLSVFQTLYPELEHLKKRTENLERRIMQHEQRLLVVEGKVDKITKDKGMAHCNGTVHSDAGRPLWSQSQNSVIRLLGRYFHLIEMRLRRYPAAVFLIAMAWPVVLHLVIYFSHRVRKQR